MRYRQVVGAQAEAPDQPAVGHARDDRPPEFHDLLRRELLVQVVEQLLIDVLMVDEEALGEAQCRLCPRAEVGVAPVSDLAGRRLIEQFAP